MPTITFLEGADTVAGFHSLFEVNHLGIAVDCGLFQRFGMVGELKDEALHV
jgi:hypothetical protein